MTLITLEDGKPILKNGKIGTEQACCCNKCSGPCDGENPCRAGCECVDEVCVECQQTPIPVCEAVQCRPGDCPEDCYCFGYQPAVAAPPEGPGCFPGEEFNPGAEEILGFCGSRCSFGNCNTLGIELADSPCNDNCPEGFNCCDGTCYDVPCDTVYTTNACFGTYTCCDCDTPCPEGCECVNGICTEEGEPP